MAEVLEDIRSPQQRRPQFTLRPSMNKHNTGKGKLNMNGPRGLTRPRVIMTHNEKGSVDAAGQRVPVPHASPCSKPSWLCHFRGTRQHTGQCPSGTQKHAAFHLCTREGTPTLADCGARIMSTFIGGGFIVARVLSKISEKNVLP